MFLKVLKNFWTKSKNIYLLKHVEYKYSVWYSNFTEFFNTTINVYLHQKTIFKKFYINHQLKLKKKTSKKKKTKTTELDKRLYFSKTILYEFLTKQNDTMFLKREWHIMYTKYSNLHKVWLHYTRRYFFYYRDYFLLRNSNLYALFNKKPQKPGKYINKPSPNRFNVYWGFLSFWKTVKIWIFSLLVLISSIYILLLKRVGILPQTLFFWFGILMLLYWLLSGFVFFIKKYQFSRYTSVIQRFWRRSYILFWLIEGGLLGVFFYLMINSSQESFYMFDQIAILKTHLFSWKLFLFKSILIVSLITYGYLLLLNLKWSVFNKNISNIFILTILLLYFVWVEFYQIYWASNFYANFFWIFDPDDCLWSLEWDARRTRILNHYIMILFLLKFWHIIFIFGCWLFFLLRITELETINYTLYSFNYQNFIILFLMSWLFMYPWLRHTFHFIIETIYFWFYVDTHASFYKILINDSYYFYFSLISNIWSSIKLHYLNNTDFLSFNFFTITVDPNTFVKTTIKEIILTNFVS